MTSLGGLRVLVPRAEGSSAELTELLQAAGAEVVAVPLLTIGPPDNLAALDACVRALTAGHYAWIGFASANALDAVLRRAGALGVSPMVPAGTRVAAVGRATAAAVRAAGMQVDLQPSTVSSAAGLADSWPPAASGDRVLLPSSAIGLPTLANVLTAKGYDVEWVPAYAPRALPMPASIAADLADGGIAAVLLTSPSIVNAMVAAARPADRTIVGCIGSTTAAAAVAAGLTVTFTAVDATMASLTDGLIAAVASQGSSVQ